MPPNPERDLLSTCVFQCRSPRRMRTRCTRATRPRRATGHTARGDEPSIGTLLTVFGRSVGTDVVVADAEEPSLRVRLELAKPARIPSRGHVGRDHRELALFALLRRESRYVEGQAADVTIGELDSAARPLSGEADLRQDRPQPLSCSLPSVLFAARGAPARQVVSRLTLPAVALASCMRCP